MKIILVILVNQLIGHCSSMDNEPATNLIKASTSHQTISYDKSHYELPQVKNVQLVQYENGKIIKLSEQDFYTLRRYARRDKKLFEDNQFLYKNFKYIVYLDPVGIEVYSQYELYRPKDIQDNPVFIERKNKRYPAKQGQLGDCWFIVALRHLQNHENLLNFVLSTKDQAFKDYKKYSGIFHFRFWQEGTWVDVVIDDQLPTNEKKLIFASTHSNEFWPALIEKAYAKLLYRSYTNLYGGHAKLSMQDLSGCISETYFLNDKLDLFEKIYDGFSRSAMISCASYGDNSVKEFGLFPNHAYAIVGLEKIVSIKNSNHEIKLLRIYNPHGKTSKIYFGDIESHLTSQKKKDLKLKIPGESWIIYSDFIKYFQDIDICNLTPNQLIGNVYAKNSNKKLLLSAKKGKWIEGMTVKQLTEYDLFENNPQYSIVLTKPDQGEKKCNILIGLSLNYRNDLKRASDTDVSFIIITVDKNSIITKPLTYNGMKTYERVDRFESNGQLDSRFILDPGTYYIVPCTHETFNRATFYLQILSEHENILEEYDRDIDIPDITKKIHTLLSENIEETDCQLFLHMSSRIDQKIDFKGLYNILKHKEFSLNKNCDSPHELDDSIIPELRLILVNNFEFNEKLSLFCQEKIASITDEVLDSYGVQGKPEYIDYSCMTMILKQNGYIINNNILNFIYTNFGNSNGLIRFKDVMKIIYILKSKIGSYCHEFGILLSLSLIPIVHNDNIKELENSRGFRKLDLRINIKQFKMIIQFIKNIKTKFNKYASQSYRSVSSKQLKNLLDEIDYKLPYNIIASIFHEYGNEVDIFYHEFVKAVVDITLIFEKIQKYTLNRKNINLNKVYNDMFFQFWQNKYEKKYSINNKRKVNKFDDNESPIKKKKSS